MTHKRFGFSALAAVLAVVCLTASVHAAFQDLGNSGWRVHYGEGLNVAFLGVTSDRAEVKIQKIADFTEPFDRGVGPVLELVFEQRSYDATEFITIDSEAVSNHTGTNWIGFNFIINEATNGASSPAHFDEVKTFGDDDPFDIGPFTTFDFNADQTRLTVGGGVVANGDTWLPGAGSGAGELVIDANPVSSGTKKFFKFDEQPLIPLPAAAWSGLTGLAGLGLMSFRKGLRRLVA